MTQGLAAPTRTRAQISERTLRKDPWWRAPAVTAVLLTIWGAYATTHVFIGHPDWVPEDHYLTPFYSPCISGACLPGSRSPGRGRPPPPPLNPSAPLSVPLLLR